MSKRLCESTGFPVKKKPFKDASCVPFEFEELTGDNAKQFLASLDVDPALLDAPTSSHKRSKSAKPSKIVEKLPKHAFSSSIHDIDLSQVQRSPWHSQLQLHPSLVISLLQSNITDPNNVQTSTIPALLDNKDVAVAAETGSGKTLSFALPICHRLITNMFNKEGPSFLVIAPTRELALQIGDVFQILLKFEESLSKSVVILTGGLAQEKQLKILKKKKPQIIVGTPGRIVDVINQDFDWFNRDQLGMIQSVVIDEADKLIGNHDVKGLLNSFIVKPQLCLFSATLDDVIKSKKVSFESQISQLCKGLSIKLNQPAIFDLRSSLIVSTATEVKCNVIAGEKDYICYQVLTSLFEFNSFKKLILFVNSIELVNRLSSLFSLLFPSNLIISLHAKMKQKSRLKSLEKFSNTDRQSIIITTDVSARGLDLPFIDGVIHYSIPSTRDSYVHRSGRTARCGNQGLSIILISPDDVSKVKKVFNQGHSLSDLPEFRNVYFPECFHSKSTLELMKNRFNLAQSIEKLTHSRQKRHFESKGKLTQMAIEAGLIDEVEENNHLKKKEKSRIDSMKNSLFELLQKDLVSVSRRKGIVVVGSSDL
ncbi:hypothetical protein P9112_007735 [Eukaryota sp. TZLM1-RC]